MREIKFRAWDFVNKIMDEDIFIDGAGNAYDYASTTYNTPNTEIQRCEFPVMQYTGMEDKNGVEIYEGDILFHPLQGKRKVFYPYSETVASYGLSHSTRVRGLKSKGDENVWEDQGRTLHECVD